MTVKLLEKPIQDQCLDWLNTIPGVRAWRQNTGAMRAEHRGKKRLVRFGQPGQADISGIGPNGIRIEIEIKAPGNTPTWLQTAWLRSIYESGGIAFWCDSLQDCAEQLRHEFRVRDWQWLERWEVR